MDGVVPLHIQFLPTEAVSKRKLIAGMLKAIPPLFEHIKTTASAVVSESVSPSLINFFLKQDFQRVGDTDDFLLDFDSATKIKGPTSWTQKAEPVL